MDDTDAEILSFRLVYYQQHWTVASHETNAAYYDSGGNGRGNVLKLILLIDESQGE